MKIRAEIDPTLSSIHNKDPKKPYPLGLCREITDAVRDALFLRLRRPRSRVDRALVAFLQEGGIIRPIWGALRGRYFQNATQIGTLYVDVSNDTVAVIKPKVEILPIERSGMEAVRDIAHYRQIVGLYWNVELYANLVAPTLAPILPMVSVDKNGRAQLQAVGDYMIALAMRDQFRNAEEWLTDGPAPPPHIIDAFQASLPPDLRLPTGQDARQAAIQACQIARTERRDTDMAWRRDRLLDYYRFRDHATARASA